MMSVWTWIFSAVFGSRPAAQTAPRPTPPPVREPSPPPAVQEPPPAAPEPPPPAAPEPPPEEPELAPAPTPINAEPIAESDPGVLDDPGSIPAPLIVLGEGFPPAPDFRPITSNNARKAMFGAFEHVHEPQADNYEHIRILGSWQNDHIVDVPIPQLRKNMGPHAPASMRFHKFGASQLQQLWQEWDEANLLGGLVSYDGAFVPRYQRGSTSALSNHAYGSAFDLNWRQNQLGQRPAALGEHGCVRELVPIANKWGFFWGGHFQSRPDGMHFEIAKLL